MSDVAAVMANRLTRVPSTPPPIDDIQRRLLPIADAVMAVMWSRPGGLSLGATWVTPATIWLCVALSAAAAILAFALITAGLGSSHLVGVLAGLLSLAVGSAVGTVALYGVRQRLLARLASR